MVSRCNCAPSMWLNFYLIYLNWQMSTKTRWVKSKCRRRVPSCCCMNCSTMSPSNAYQAMACNIRVSKWLPPWITSDLKEQVINNHNLLPACTICRVEMELSRTMHTTNMHFRSIEEIGEKCCRKVGTCHPLRHFVQPDAKQGAYRECTNRER